MSELLVAPWFGTVKQQMVCEYADTAFTEEQINEIEKLNTEKASESSMNWDTYDDQSAESKMGSS